MHFLRVVESVATGRWIEIQIREYNFVLQVLYRRHYSAQNSATDPYKPRQMTFPQWEWLTLGHKFKWETMQSATSQRLLIVYIYFKP